MRVIFHVELELDHKDQIAPICDDLSVRYGVAEAVWADYVAMPPPDAEDALTFDEAEAAGVDGTNRFRSLR